MKIPTNFIVSPDTQTGEVYGTEFTFQTDLPSQYIKFAWDFGDNSNLVYNKKTTSHIYQYPGIYTVQLSSWTDFGYMYVDVATIDVDYVYRDSVLFTQVPNKYGKPGIVSTEPFTISVTSAKIDQPISIVLQSFNSKSVPYYAIPSKWKFITPHWRFIDEDRNILHNPIVLETTPIYNQENRVIAVKAEKKVYYLDDLSTGVDPEKDCPLILVATLSTERFTYPPESIIYPYASYSNNEVVRAVIPWQINDVVPTKLVVTENFLNDIYPVKWSNVPIPVMITLQSDMLSSGSYSPIEGSVANVLSYPRTNRLGSLHPINLRLSSDSIQMLSGVHYKVEEMETNGPLYFTAEDEVGNVTAGYKFTTITPLTTLPGNVYVAADTLAVNAGDTTQSFGFPIGFEIYSDVYISHPEKHVINRINVPYPYIKCPGIAEYRKLGIIREGSLNFITTMSSAPTEAVNYFLSGEGGGVYAMTFNPKNNRLYTADIELDTINCYSAGITLLTSVPLSSILPPSFFGPSYISVDGESNIWVSLFDSQKILKFDADLNYVLSAFPDYGDIELVVEENGQLYNYSIEENYVDTGVLEYDDNLSESTSFNPPIVETDQNNDVWVCYPEDGISTLFKFNSEGESIVHASLPPDAFPVSLSIAADNAVWVACKNTNNIMSFSEDGTLVENLSGLIRPSYIAHERSGNICILHGYNLYSYYDVTTKNLRTWRVYSGVAALGLNPEIKEIFSYSQEDIEKGFYVDEIWGGLCTDVFNRVWIIDSELNNYLVFKPNDVLSLKVYPVIPNKPGANYIQHVIQGGETFVTDIPVDPNRPEWRSSQAGGDWSGNRWYQKYAAGYNVIPVEGISAPFKVYDLEDSFKIAKVNESWNCAEYFKSLALPEVLSQNVALFDEFFTAVLGDGDILKESAGRVIYEKIANFVSNHGDVDTADLNVLNSIAEQMNVESKTFGKGFPAAVNRLLHLFSVPKHQLRGVPKLESDIKRNIGRILTETDLVTAAAMYYVADRKTSVPFLVYAPILSGMEQYPLNRLEMEGLRQPVLSNYYFFTYNAQNLARDFTNVEETSAAPIIYSGNLIDWNHVNTTLSYNLSSNEEWYGENGIIEILFNNLLTKELYEQ